MDTQERKDLEKAREFLAQGEKAQAAQALVAVICDKWNDIEAWWLVANALTRNQHPVLDLILLMQPDHKEARQMLSTLTVGPKPVVDALLKEANDLIKEKKPAEATQIILPVLAMDEKNAKAWWLLANTIPKLKERRCLLHKVLKLKPDFEPAQSMLDRIDPRLILEPATPPIRVEMPTNSSGSGDLIPVNPSRKSTPPRPDNIIERITTTFRTIETQVITYSKRRSAKEDQSLLGGLIGLGITQVIVLVVSLILSSVSRTTTSLGSNLLLVFLYICGFVSIISAFFSAGPGFGVLLMGSEKNTKRGSIAWYFGFINLILGYLLNTLLTSRVSIEEILKQFPIYIIALIPAYMASYIAEQKFVQFFKVWIGVFFAPLVISYFALKYGLAFGMDVIFGKSPMTEKEWDVLDDLSDGAISISPNENYLKLALAMAVTERRPEVEEELNVLVEWDYASKRGYIYSITSKGEEALHNRPRSY